MKIKSLLLAILALSFYSTIQAQFSTDPTDPLRISYRKGDTPKVAIAYDGSVFISHVEWNNSAECFPDIARSGGSSFIRVVHLFPDGTFDPDWGGEEGIIVVNHITATYVRDYGMTVLKDGSIVILHSDARNAPPFEARNNDHYQMHGYRYTMDGQSIWNSEGVPISIIDQDGYSELRAERSKVVQLTDGNLLVTWDNFADPVYHNDLNGGKSRITKIRLTDGSRMWEPISSVSSGNHTVPIAAENGNMLMVYKSDNIPYVEKFDKNGDHSEVGRWVDGAIQLSNISVMTGNPLVDVRSDGDGGAMILWHGLSGASHYTMLQYVDKEGQMVMGSNGLIVSDDGIHSVQQQMAVNVDERMVYVAYEQATHSDSNYLRIAKVGYDGNIIFRHNVVPVSKYGYTIYGVVNTGKNIIIIAREVFTASGASGANNIRAYGYAYDGTQEWIKVMAEDPEGAPYSPRGIGKVSNYHSQAIVVYEGGGEDEEFIVAQNINRKGEMGVDAVSAKKTVIVNSDVEVKTYPNPVENILNIEINTKETQTVTVKVVAVNGTAVSILAQNQKVNGERSFVWTPSKKQKGLYFVTVVANDIQTTKKIVVK